MSEIKKNQILMALLEGPLNFNRLRYKTLISPRYLKMFLEDLNAKELIKEDSRNWRRGRRKLYSLTEKGENALLQNSNWQLRDYLGKFSRIIRYIRYDPERSEYQMMQARLRIALNQSTDLEHRFQALQEIYGALYEYAKTVHELLLYFSLESKSNVGEFIEKHVLCFDHFKHKTNLYCVSKEGKTMQVLEGCLARAERKFNFMTKEDFEALQRYYADRSQALEK